VSLGAGKKERGRDKEEWDCLNADHKRRATAQEVKENPQHLRRRGWVSTCTFFVFLLLFLEITAVNISSVSFLNKFSRTHTHTHRSKKTGEETL
jgi:hypothetical protein